jgi:hypothetical protein
VAKPAFPRLAYARPAVVAVRRPARQGLRDAGDSGKIYSAKPRPVCLEALGKPARRLQRGHISARRTVLSMSWNHAAGDQVLCPVLPQNLRPRAGKEGSAMFVGYVAVAAVTAAMNVWAAWLDFRSADSAVANAAKVEVPPSWLLPLGALKFVGALGLIAGIAVPLIGVAAAIGLVLFFVCAVFAHLRVSWYSAIPFPITFLVLAVVALILRLASADDLWDLRPHV